LLWQRTALAIAAIALAAFLIAFAFAGSSKKLPDGVQIANVDVGGMSPREAQRTLEARSRSVARKAVMFRAGGRRWWLTASELDVSVNWGAAVSNALRQGDGSVPIRGFRRLGVRLFGAEVTPAAQAYEAALQYEIDRMSRGIDRPYRDASLRLNGLTPAIQPGRIGRRLQREAAARAIVQALASLQRPLTVDLPVEVVQPRVTAAALRPAAAEARTAVSAPVRLIVGASRLELRPPQLARMLELPARGQSTLSIGGPGADSFFARLNRSISLPPRNAGFEPVSGSIRLVPSRNGRGLNVMATASSVMHAALSLTNRRARVFIKTTPPSRTTAWAKQLGIHEIVGTYTTEYGGVANRIHNVRLVAHLIDNHYIAPRSEFSFNKTTGVRDAAKGFLEAPVIINGELQTGLGGGVCQVSTTVFNAAYEAGLKITARTNHALYISHYPLGRDATVNYPDIDLRFVNDTDHWLLLRTFVGSYSLTVTLYGTSPHRKVVSETQPLTVAGPVPVVRTNDPTLLQGQEVVNQEGSPPLATSVERKVYGADGKLLYDDTWASHYTGETQIVLVGTKKPPPTPTTTEKKPPVTTTTGTTLTTTTTPTTTGQATPVVPGPGPTIQP
jgi:vancomycin resistance protein YoaR